MDFLEEYRQKLERAKARGGSIGSSLTDYEDDVENLLEISEYNHNIHRIDGSQARSLIELIAQLAGVDD